MDVKINGNKMVITIDIENGRTPSSTGKTLVVATTKGNVKTGVTDQRTGKEIVIGVNAYVKAD